MNDIQVLQSRINALNVLKKRIHYSKLIVLKEIRLMRTSYKDSIQHAVFTKDLFVYIKKQFKINSYFLSGTTSKNNHKNLWILVTAPKYLLSVTNKPLEEKLLQNIKNDDLVIAVGKDAIEFCKLQNFNIVNHFESMENNFRNIVYTIAELFNSKSINFVKMILHSSFVDNEPIDILPLSSFNINLPNVAKILDKSKKYHFYANIPSAMQQLFYNYLLEIITAINVDSKIYIEKQKLLHHTYSEKNIDYKINKFNNTINKLKAEQLTNEIILLISIKKQLSVGKDKHKN